MTDLRTQLEAALAGSFSVERELGQGGMAKVYLARDLRHGRQVAVKVFLPEFASAFGHGRFLREIRTAANLNHPNILTLFDSGETDGLLYYVMPYVEGESLAQRLSREGPLPIEQALAIVRQVAAALQHAHNRGIVHRDIKPGNILLSGSTAFVADFGIAQALEEGGERLTSTGMAIGTPAYMSPEQSGGYGQLDGRADIYSLGCVLYEMLVGEPPFGGRSAQAILARHSVERVPSVRAVRDTVPWAVEQAIHRALAKIPADRFATADEFAEALAPERLSQPVPIAALPGYSRTPTRWVFAAGTLAGLGLVVLVALAPWSRTAAKPAVADPDLVAILPFRAMGAADTALNRVAANLAGLFAEHFPGEGGPRAVADSTTAGLRLTGQVARIDDRLVLGARLTRAGAGDVVLARVEKLVAPRDSILPLVDLAVAQLLAQTVGESPEWVKALGALPLPVVRTYLAARHDYFRGNFDAAGKHYLEVLRSDSAFAPAALGLLNTGRYASEGKSLGRALALAARPRLGEADQLYLNAMVGPQWPRVSDRLQVDSAWNRAVLVAPNRAELQWRLGEHLFHEGPWTGAPDILKRADAAFRGAIRLEPGFVPALGHLIDLAASAGQTADVRALGQRYLLLDSVGDLADYYRWRVALALREDRSLNAVRARLDSLSEATLDRIITVTQLDGVAIEDGFRAADALWARGGEWNNSRWRYTRRREVALNRGRPLEALDITKRRMANQPLRPRDRLGEVVDAIYWDADTTLAAALTREQEAAVDLHPGSPPDPNDQGYYDVCAVSLWRMARGTPAKVPAAIADLRRGERAFAGAPDTTEIQGDYLGVCADVLEAQLAAWNRSGDLRDRIAKIDSTARRSKANTWILAAANLTAAKLWESQGDMERALAATRRRGFITDINEYRVLVALTTFLREEGRLAAKTGDRTGAIKAYRHYLSLRDKAEPSLASQVAQVRAELKKLEASP